MMRKALRLCSRSTPKKVGPVIRLLSSARVSTKSLIAAPKVSDTTAKARPR